jgi:O-antigen/teichoic acid export membrane protein
VHDNGTALHRRLAGLFLTRLARASALLFAGTLSSGLLGYVFQVLMGRMLSTSDYGLFSAVMALFAVFSAPLGTLQMVIARKVSEYRAKADEGSIRHFYRSINSRTALFGAAMVAGSLLFAPYLQSYLKAPNLLPVYLLGALLIATFPAIINDAYLQALQRFSWLSGGITLRVLFRIVFSAALVWIGWGVSGALGGAVLATVAGFVVTYGPLHAPLSRGRGQPFRSTHVSLGPAVPVLVANLAFAVMTQIDIVLVNHYFPAHEAGLYASASILGKAVMYLPSGIAVALFPMVAENQARQRSSAHLLFQAVSLTTLLCMAGAIFYFLFGEQLITLLYGESYRDAGVVLKYFGFAILPMALVMVAEYFLIAKGRVVFAYLFAAVAPLQVLAIHFWHESLQTVVAITAASGVCVALVGYAILWRAFAGDSTAKAPPAS